ncbi:adenosylcobinamide-GDP ribazoletransferase [Alicyclobacillus pomorum]|uniref:adenosylcobinamide-GDP ribazoletransferase n=1 Tax=Alicyclobacillus pomorum TaxID=204470 RepID=UPI0003FD9EF0|nr:adenosylcobinamide-GDP ribazoletransferase [Alicyclobacillus pomorum]
MFAPIRWLILALQFATILPTPSVRTATERDIRCSVVWFPVIGMLLGVLLWVFQSFFVHHMPSLAASVVSLSIYTLATGALHLDGLMDTADAMGSRRPREAALEIMKDSRVGAMGVVVCLFAILGKWSAIASISPDHWEPFVVVPMMSRLGMIWSMVVAPSARSQGLGALFARKIPRWTVAVATCLCGAVCGLVLPFQQCLWVLLYAILTVTLFTGWMVHRFGGTTGDTYGALNEIMEWVGWYVFLCASA